MQMPWNPDSQTQGSMVHAIPKFNIEISDGRNLHSIIFVWVNYLRAMATLWKSFKHSKIIIAIVIGTERYATSNKYC